MTDWTGEQRLVYDDIKAEGFEITVRKPGSIGTFDPDFMEWDSTGTPTDVLTYAIRKEYALKEIDGTIIQRGDSILVVPAYGLSEIDVNCKVLIGFDEQNIVSIDQLSPGNVPLLFNLQVRS